MHSDPDEIHFNCPKCKRPMSGDKALLNELINCPDCGEAFIPTPRKPEPAPEPAKSEIGLECPLCLRVVFVEKKAMLWEFVTCPNCAAAFSPVQAAKAYSFKSQPQLAAPLDLKSRRQRIRRNADMLSGIGGLFAVFGLLVGFSSITLVSESSDDAKECFIASAALFGVGLWFYLIGQVVHIRANTEK